MLHHDFPRLESLDPTVATISEDVASKLAALQVELPGKEQILSVLLPVLREVSP